MNSLTASSIGVVPSAGNRLRRAFNSASLAALYVLASPIGIAGKAGAGAGAGAGLGFNIGATLVLGGGTSGGVGTLGAGTSGAPPITTGGTGADPISLVRAPLPPINTRQLATVSCLFMGNSF